MTVSTQLLYGTCRSEINCSVRVSDHGLIPASRGDWRGGARASAASSSSSRPAHLGPELGRVCCSCERNGAWQAWRKVRMVIVEEGTKNNNSGRNDGKCTLNCYAWHGLCAQARIAHGNDCSELHQPLLFSGQIGYSAWHVNYSIHGHYGRTRTTVLNCGICAA